MTFARKHLLELEDLTSAEITHILDTAARYKQSAPARLEAPLRGHTVVNLFYEPSTRTRMSFELAAKKLSADVLNFSSAASSASKGETLVDTARNLESMGARVFVVRHPAAGAARLLSRSVQASIVNAGDGAHEHPTQGLLDLFTLRERFGHLEGLKVAIVGDITHSRVARSNIAGLTRMGAEVRLAGPPTLLPTGIEMLGARAFDRVEEAIQGVHAIMMLRIQLERQKGSFLPSLQEYSALYGLTPERLCLAHPDVVILHPGPLNRGVEISSELADGPRSLILDQVANGVLVRMAVLALLGGVTS